MYRFRIAALFVLIIINCAWAQDPKATIDAPEAGIRITLPDVGWVHQEQRGGDGLTGVSIGPADAGGLIVLGVQISIVADTSEEAVRTQIAQLRGAIAGSQTITDVEDLVLEIDGQMALGLRVKQTAFNRTFRVNLVFMRVRGFQYRIQFHAPLDQFDEEWKKAQQVLAGFEFVELDEAARERVQLRGLAGRCGSQVDWATGWEDASNRARESGRLIVVSIFAQPGFELGNQLNEGVFMSPAIVALMEHRFVGWRWSAGLVAPFVDHDVFGLSGSTFGVGLLVCSPDGNVVRQVFVPEAELVADVLRGVLLEYPQLAPPPPAPASATPAVRAAFLIDSGQLDTARRMLLTERAKEDSAVLSHQLARLYGADRNGDAALKAIEDARRQWTAEDAASLSPAALDLLEVDIRIGLGQYVEAGEAVQVGFEHDPDDQHNAALLLRQGVLAWVNGDVARTRSLWSDATTRFPEQPSAWIAAAGLIGPALQIELTPDLRWPTEALERMVVLPEAAPPSATLDIDRSLSSAVRWLLDAQRSDGAWDLPFEQRNSHPAPDQITMASQAICTMALSRVAAEWSERESTEAAQLRDAAHRGLRRYLEYRQLEREHPRPVAFMDYTCWGSSYGLFSMNAILEPDHGMIDLLSPAEIAAVRAEITRLIGDLARIQAANGGWSYYLSGTVDGATSVTAMSFTSATVLNALQISKTNGFEIPADILERGYACLASLRGTNGAFEYMRQGAGPHEAGAVAPEGAAARGPLCTLTLVRAGLVDEDVMKPAFETYIQHLSGFGREARKALMHAGLDTQGSHYLLYDYSTAAEALRATDTDVVDTETRRQVRASILREMARCHNVDGSFVDNPIIGTAPGTGLAILALLDLIADPSE